MLHHIVINAWRMIVLVNSAYCFIVFTHSSAVWSTVAYNHVSQRRTCLLFAHISDHMQTCLHTHTQKDISDMKDASSVWTNLYVSLSMCVCVKAFWHFAQEQTAALSSGKIRQNSSASILTYQLDYLDNCDSETHANTWSKITNEFGLGHMRANMQMAHVWRTCVHVEKTNHEE